MEKKVFTNAEDFVEYAFTDSEFVPDNYFKPKKNLETVSEKNILDENYNFDKDEDLFVKKKNDAFFTDKNDDFTKISNSKILSNLSSEKNPNNETFEIINKNDINNEGDNLSLDSLELAFSSGKTVDKISEEKFSDFETINTLSSDTFEKKDDFEDKFSMLFYKEPNNFYEDQIKPKEVLEDIIEENENVNTVIESKNINDIVDSESDEDLSLEKKIDNINYQCNNGLDSKEETSNSYVEIDENNEKLKIQEINQACEIEESLEKEKKVDKIFEEYKLKNEALLKVKDEKEKKNLTDLKQSAEKELEAWYEIYNKEKDNKFSNNRANQEIILEIAKKTESSKEWKAVVDLCNFNSKNQSKKDVSKLKSVLMKLKESSITK